MADPDLMDKIVSLCKRRGFIFQSSEIYGGLNGAWDLLLKKSTEGFRFPGQADRSFVRRKGRLCRPVPHVV